MRIQNINDEKDNEVLKFIYKEEVSEYFSIERELEKYFDEFNRDT